MRIGFSLAVATFIALPASPLLAASATGTLSVSAVVIDRCAVSTDRVHRSAVTCNGVVPPYKVQDVGSSASGTRLETRRIVFF